MYCGYHKRHEKLIFAFRLSTAGERREGCKVWRSAQEQPWPGEVEWEGHWTRRGFIKGSRNRSFRGDSESLADGGYTGAPM